MHNEKEYKYVIYIYIYILFMNEYFVHFVNFGYFVYFRTPFRTTLCGTRPACHRAAAGTFPKGVRKGVVRKGVGDSSKRSFG